MKRILVLFVLFGTLFSTERIPPFLDLKVRDADAQAEIDALKAEFISERDAIHERYKKEMEALKSQKRTEMQETKSSFHQRFTALSEKYPDVKKLQAKKKGPLLDPALKDKKDRQKRDSRKAKKSRKSPVRSRD